MASKYLTSSYFVIKYLPTTFLKPSHKHHLTTPPLLSFLKAWKMSTSWLPLYTHTAAATARQYPTRTKLASYNSTSRKLYGNTLSCRAASSIRDFDLYDLLGIDSSSDSSRIKAAYRALQKQCHPDIAGPAGHDMSIILNEAYSLLSDPSSRLAYDKVRTQIH